MKTRFTNILNETKYLNIEEGKITVLTAHNGFGKTTINNILKDRHSDNYIEVKTLHSDIQHDEDWSYLTRNKQSEPFGYLWINFYVNLLKKEEFKEWADVLRKGIRIILTSMKNNGGLKRHFDLESLKKIIPMFNNLKSTRVPEEFNASFINFTEILKEGFSDSNGNIGEVSEVIAHSNMHSVSLEMPEEGFFIEEVEFLKEELELFSLKINESLEEMRETNEDVFDFFDKSGYSKK